MCPTLKLVSFKYTHLAESSVALSEFIYLFIFAATEYIRYNVDKLSRVYPSGAVRTNSSNFDPVPLWNAGCQIGKTAVY